MNETSPSFRMGHSHQGKKANLREQFGCRTSGPQIASNKNVRLVASFKPPVDAFAPTPNVEGCGGHGLAGGGAGGVAFVMPGGGALKPVMVWADASTVIFLSAPAAVCTRISAAVLADLSFIFGFTVKPKSLAAAAAVVGGPSPPAAHGAAPAGARATPEEIGPSSGVTSAAR